MTVNIRSAQGVHDIAHDYFSQLLKISLEASKKPNEKIILNAVSLPITQNRAIELLKSDDSIDVDWFGENSTRRAELGYVDLPLMDGTLGMRMLVIRRKDKPKFDAITHASELKQLSACQGAHWPDSDIMEYNHYNVIRVTQFETMYKLLRRGRCDYFPRSITEGYGEVRNMTGMDLIPYDRILLVYRFNMKFFTQKFDNDLLERLEKGLLIIKATGKFKALLESHPSSKAAFPLSQYKDSLIFTLKNPEVSN